MSSTSDHEVSDSLRLCSFLLPHTPPVALLPLLPALEARGQPAAHSAQREADDLFAMAGTMNHLTRILEDKTNAIERLGMRWKEKSLTIVAGPFTEYKPGDVVESISNGGVRWIWRVVEGMEPLGTWLDNRGCSEASMWHRISKANSMFYAKKALFCDPKLPVKEPY